MQYVRSISGSVSKTWNSINPATLSGAIDVVVVEGSDGILSCSPFHVRFGKFQLLRPSDKKVIFCVNDVERDYPMKVGEGGEAFFVFETRDRIPQELQTSPLVSPETSPITQPTHLGEPDLLDLSGGVYGAELLGAALERPKSVDGTTDTHEGPLDSFNRPANDDWADVPSRLEATKSRNGTLDTPTLQPSASNFDIGVTNTLDGSTVQDSEAFARAVTLSKRLWALNISTQISASGDLKLDMTGYKSDEENALKAEVIARKILSEDLEGSVDIGSLIGVDENGNLWVYSSEAAKEAADRKAGMRALNPLAMRSSDALSDPGYHSDDAPSDSGSDNFRVPTLERRDSDSALGSSNPGSPDAVTAQSNMRRRPTKNFAKTLRLTDVQLKSLDLKPGPNKMSFSVNKATCTAFIYYWRHDVPIVISDIDGTITKSDALGHVLNMIGRDWTHLGVAKLYTDIAANGYNILYLTSRSVGQADSTRGYLHGVTQEGYKLPRGPVILSPDRMMAALRREVYLRKPEVFKMACLRDIMNLFQEPVPEGADPSNLHFHQRTPFYAGFGNRLTDALSYRSVAIPPTRIFTINSNAEVNLHLLTLNSYRTSYLSIWELVDHYFPPVGLLVKEGGEEYTDFNYWRDKPRELLDFSASESEEEEDEDEEEDDESDDGYDRRQSFDQSEQDDMEGSFMSDRNSVDESILESSAVLDTVKEEDELQRVSELRESFIAEEPEFHEHVIEDDDSGDILVEESRQLEALNLEADEERGENRIDLRRMMSSPSARPSSSSDGMLDAVDKQSL